MPTTWGDGGLFAVAGNRTRVQVCNLALARLGSKALLTGDITTELSSFTSPEGVACAQFWDLARVGVLLEHAWTFAERQVPLGLGAEHAEDPPHGWAYRYKLPASGDETDFGIDEARDEHMGDWLERCVRPLSLWSGKRVGLEQRGERIPFQVWNGGGNTPDGIVTDFGPDENTGAPFLTYTADILGDAAHVDHGLARWPLYFVDAVAWRLAAEICLPLTSDLKRTQAVSVAANAALLRAIAQDNRQGQADQEPESGIIAVRG